MSMASDPVVDLRGVCKVYSRAGLRGLLRRAASEPWPAADVARAGSLRAASGVALEDITFDLARGDSLAILGANGAGKSTLLRLLAGTSRPTSGSLLVRGRLRSLLELGAGFLEDSSGRENAASLLALDAAADDFGAEALRRAIEFAEIGTFVDEPVRAYSSGMRLRLAYAIAMAVDPEVLVVDEILAVGDESFQRKCSLHVESFLARGGTLVLATHNLYHAEKLCRRAIWLRDGRVELDGPVREVTAAYRASVESGRSVLTDGLPREGPETRLTSAAVANLALTISDQGGRSIPSVREGEVLEVRIVPEPRDDLRLHLEVARPDGTLVLALQVGGGCVRLDSCPLLPARYRLALRLAVGDRRILATLEFDCLGGSRELGTVRLAHRWS